MLGGALRVYSTGLRGRRRLGRGGKDELVPGAHRLVGLVPGLGLLRREPGGLHVGLDLLERGRLLRNQRVEIDEMPAIARLDRPGPRADLLREEGLRGGERRRCWVEGDRRDCRKAGRPEGKTGYGRNRRNVPPGVFEPGEVRRRSDHQPDRLSTRTDVTHVWKYAAKNQTTARAERPRSQCIRFAAPIRTPRSVGVDGDRPRASRSRFRERSG
jgi:hypothetical protein